MIIFVSQRTLNDRIRSLENLQHLSDSELLLVLDRHARALFEHIKGYGVFFSSVQPIGNDDVAALSCDLRPSFTEQDRANRLEGIAFLSPICVTAHKRDTDALVLNKVARAGIAQIWESVANTFDRVRPNELEDLYEKAASRSLNNATIDTTYEDMSSEAGFRLFCLTNGLPIPGQQRLNAEVVAENEQKARAEARSKAIADKIAEEERRGESNQAWGWREIG